MRLALAIAAMLCFCATGFAGYVYDAGTKNLSLLPSDLVNVIDPPELSNVQQSFGFGESADPLSALNAFSALNPRVINFDAPANSAQGTPLSVEVQGLVKFGFAAAYNWGGITSHGRQAFSGGDANDDISGVETQPFNAWFDVTSVGGGPITAIGLCAGGRSDDMESGPGDFIVTLDDGTEVVAAQYPKFGGPTTTLQYIWVGYVAPEGRVIASFRCTRPGGGNSYIAIDDLSFIPEPASLSLIGLGGLALLRRRK